MELRPTMPSMVPMRYFTNSPIDTLRLKVTLKMSRNQSDLAPTHKTTFKSAMLRLRRQRTEKAKFDGLAKPIEQQPSSVPTIENETGGAIELPHLNEAEITRVISWQEKIYTAREILTKCHSRHEPKSHLDKSYESDIKAFLKAQYPNKTEESETLSRNYILSQGGVLLATKVDVDDYIHPSMLKENLTTSNNHHLNPLALRRALRSSATRNEQCARMFVVACVDLPDTENDIKHWAKVQRCGYEQILYQINAYNNGVYEITPGLTSDAKPENAPYVFRSPAGVWYEYWIENVAEPPPVMKAAIVNSSKSQAHLTFKPPRGHVQLNVFGEILRTEDVDSDSIWIEYQVDIPDGWQWSKLDPNRIESSLTQISRSVEVPGRDRKYCKVCNFAFPIEFEMQGRLEDDLLSWPTIFFQVSSTDFWECDRAEGYASVQVPSSPGMYELSLPLWRPSGNWAAARARFFVGSCPVLKDIYQGGLPANARDNGSFNRYGFTTIQNGSLLVRLNVVLTFSSAFVPKLATTDKKAPLLLTSGIDEALRRQKELLDTLEALRVSSIASRPERSHEHQGPKVMGTNRRSSIR